MKVILLGGPLWQHQRRNERQRAQLLKYLGWGPRWGKYQQDCEGLKMARTLS